MLSFSIYKGHRISVHSDEAVRSYVAPLGITSYNANETGSGLCDNVSWRKQMFISTKTYMKTRRACAWCLLWTIFH